MGEVLEAVRVNEEGLNRGTEGTRNGLDVCTVVECLTVSVFLPFHTEQVETLGIPRILCRTRFQYCIISFSSFLPFA